MQTDDRWEQEYPDPETVVSEISDTESWEVLREHEFGRLAYHLLGEVHIVPINYATDGERLVFRTAEGSKFLGIHMNDDVAFEVDEIEDERATSVVLRGRAHVLEGEARNHVESLPLRPWVPTAKFNVVAIEPTEITGRRFRLDRPWLHMKPTADDV